MHRIFFENVRCFSSRQIVPLAPLTVLVGENSSGKSTFLALVRLAWDLAAQMRAPDFNEEPFLLGAYDQIASAGSVEDPFFIGTELRFSQDSIATIEGRFEARLGQPVLAKLSIDLDAYHISIHFHGDGVRANLSVAEPSGRSLSGEGFVLGIEGLSTTLFLLYGSIKGLVHSEDRWKLHDKLLLVSNRLRERPFAFAPIRTRPHRTYDPIKSPENPEGSHVPMLLAGTYLREPAEWKDIIEALDDFGHASGLFGRVEVRRLGNSESDPFQIRVHVGGKAANLIDVGYGVSQALPIVVDSLRGKQGGTFLLQQPEVHLHPKAQAELGSLLGTLAKLQDKQFIVETHSDYLVDRIRMDIRDKKNGLRPEDVSLLYFERRNGEAQIHRLELDEHGNIVNAPPGYRSFFLEEERRFLGG
jgi:predicted ATPase